MKRQLRRLAAALLESAVRIAPSDARDWGRAMLAELPHIDGTWAAFAWAVGGAWVLVRRAAISLFFPGRETGLARTGFFRRRVSLRQAAFAVSTVFIVGALLFFAAPPFRQGLRVSLGAWTGSLHAASSQPNFKAVARQAEARHDAHGLAFAAMTSSRAGTSARLAEEAVRIDPNLLWVYAVVALKYPGLPEVHRWSFALQRFDPQNAVIPLIEASSIDRTGSQVVAEWSRGQKWKEPGLSKTWQSAMAAAFASPKFDDYQGRLQALGTTVVAQYSLHDSQAHAVIEGDALPARMSLEVRQFANQLLESGEKLQAEGNPRAAGDQYWIVARFGQVLDTQAHGLNVRRLGASLQSAAYLHLRALSAERGRSNEAALFAYLGKTLDPAHLSASLIQKPVFGDYVARRNAFVLQISALMFLIFSGLLIAAVSIFAAGRSRSRFGLAGQGALMFVFLASAAGLLISSATVYLTYRPYSYLLHGMAPSSAAGQSSGLRNFLTAIHSLPGIDVNYAKLPVYFWTAVILAAVAGLTLILLRHIREPRLNEADSRSH